MVARSSKTPGKRKARPAAAVTMTGMHSLSDQRKQRMHTDRAELVERMMLAAPHDGTVQAQPGLQFSRFSSPTELHHGFYEPCLCVIAQGAKTLSLGKDRFRYDAANYMISTVGVPMVAQVVEATPGRPYLGLRLDLDPAVVSSLMVEAGNVPTRSADDTRAVNVSTLDPELLDAALRLVRLVERPDEYRMLSPLIIREIIYRLLIGAQSSRLRHLATLGGQAHRMARAVKKLRTNFDKPLRIEALAKELGMSLSGFHAHFKAVTAMSPLQYQKQLRLQEARRLMLSEALDAAEAGFRVGYDDASHFSREYKRHFGNPPLRDVEQLRRATSA
jgi:AraC-like DNA-binding protein